MGLLLGLLLGLGETREAFEFRYQRAGQADVFTAAARIYDPAYESQLKIAYASFTPELSEEPGRDLGFGLHVVKRLDLKEYRVEVNEAWPENRRDGGILLPDELRIKVTRGGEILFDSLRVAWGPAGELTLARQSLWDGNRRRRLRVPVSAPLSCVRCHRDGRETRVPPATYGLAPEQMPGYREYLEQLDRPEEFRERVRRTLADPLRATRVPGLHEKILEYRDRGVYFWLGEDSGGNEPESYLDRQGYYRSGGTILVDALEDVFEGKYRWWEPVTVIPQ